ncbi:MAG: DUF692 domain-containing protein [Alphaproteobacteria bacterium]
MLPIRAGVGFKPQHADAALAAAGAVGWLEVHPENYMVDGGPRHAVLSRMRERFPLSLHAVATSLGGAEPPDGDHLKALRALADRYQPAQVSEHLAWSAHDGVYLADLLPMPRARAVLDRLVENIDQVQTALGRRILIENPSNYLELPDADLAEPDFLVEAAQRAGCGLLLDVNNIHVSAHNLGFAAAEYLDAVPGDLVEEIHLAGHAVDDAVSPPLLIDDHSSAVPDPVWALYRDALGKYGPKPTLIEWDTDVPEWLVLRAEADAADTILRHAVEQAA